MATSLNSMANDISEPEPFWRDPQWIQKHMFIPIVPPNFAGLSEQQINLCLHFPRFAKMFMHNPSLFWSREELEGNEQVKPFQLIQEHATLEHETEEDFMPGNK